jgi:hypothetical protein
MTPTEVRLKLRSAGFSPLPLNGKAPVIDAWQKRLDATDHEIEGWSRTRPAATNTGILTRLTPTLDIDIREEAAAAAVEGLARERFEERGYVLVRFGRAPKRCIPFRTLTPFPKIVVDLIAPDGTGEKLELLGDGQQVVVHGVHPETGNAYSWFGGAPGEIKHEDLPDISAEEAKTLVDDAARLLVEKFGYRLKTAKPSGNGAGGKPYYHFWRSKGGDYPVILTGVEHRNDADGRIYAEVRSLDGILSFVPRDELVSVQGGEGAAGDGRADWDIAPDVLMDHDRLAALTMRLLKSGMNEGAAVNFLRTAVTGLKGVDEERRQWRLGEIPDMVSSAQAKLDERPRPTGDEEKVVYAPTPFEPRDPAKFPRRQFLYGRHYVRKYVSMTVAPGDVGKTALTLAEAVAMAAHRPLLGVHFKQPYRIWYWNGEDPREEIDRRVLAICERHKIDQQALVGNLFLDSGRDTKIVVAEMVGRAGFKIVVPVKEALIAALIARKIDIITIDPFVKAHRVSENDNMFMDAVATAFAEIAEAANCAVELVQHTRKTNGEEVTLEDARGAGSTTAAARMVRTLNRIPKANAPLAGLKEEEARYYVRIDDDAKSNLAPPQKATWFRLANVGLGNFGPDPALEDEDHVQVAEQWSWPDAFMGVGGEVLREVQRQVDDRPRRADRQAKDWIGFLIVDVLGLDREDKAALAKATEMFRQWRGNHMFKTVQMPNESRKLVRSSSSISTPAESAPPCSTLVEQTSSAVEQGCVLRPPAPGAPPPPPPL